jgi:hypothetical protein
MSALSRLAVLLALGVSGAIASANQMSPSAPSRQDASNFKDMVLAICVSKIYQKQSEASADAASSARALVEWTRYDADVAPDEIEKLVATFTKRDYQNPLGDNASRSSKFDFLKCLDLFHSRELESLTRRVVSARPK